MKEDKQMEHFNCPLCKKFLIVHEQSLKCVNNHCFDISKQGYVNLLKSNTKNHGDNQEMIRARSEFLNKGYYDILVRAIIESLSSHSFKVVADLGCGEGYYTKKIQAAFSQAQLIGFDLSKDALKYASKQDKNIDYALANLFELPLPDASTDLALSLFAPLALDEVSRILKKDGIFLCVNPGIKHLYELKEVVYEHPYLNEELEIKHPDLILIETKSVQGVFTLEHNQDILNLFSMTPYSFKTSITDRKKLDSITSLTITLDFKLRLFKKRTISA